MPFLPLIAETLRSVGYDAIHVRDYKMQNEDDEIIFDRAKDEDRIFIAADTDFGTLLAFRQESKPSVILFRHSFPRNPARQALLLLANLPQIEQVVSDGSIVTFEKDRICIRSLPIER